jgi:hypothetical protein
LQREKVGGGGIYQHGQEEAKLEGEKSGTICCVGTGSASGLRKEKTFEEGQSWRGRNLLQSAVLAPILERERMFEEAKLEIHGLLWLHWLLIRLGFEEKDRCSPAAQQQQNHHRCHRRQKVLLNH